MEGRPAKPQYDCAATGQMHYRTFDGKVYNFYGGKCEYVLMTDCLGTAADPYCKLEHADFNVFVKNTRCKHSYEAYMCKQVRIQMKVCKCGYLFSFGDK